MNNPEKAGSWSFDFVSGRINGFQRLFSGANNVRDRHRSLCLTIVNATNKNLLLDHSHFDSGSYVQSFAKIPAGTAEAALVANKQGSFCCGVSGGLSFKIEGTNTHIGCGFTNPHWGGYKFSALFGNKDISEAAYHQAKGNEPVIRKEGEFELQVRQHETNVAQMGYVWTLTQ